MHPDTTLSERLSPGLLHLPKDVLNSIVVKDLANSPLGGAPQYIDTWGVPQNLFTAVVNLVVDFALSVTNFLVNPTGVAADLGMKVPVTLQSITCDIQPGVGPPGRHVVELQPRHMRGPGHDGG